MDVTQSRDFRPVDGTHSEGDEELMSRVEEAIARWPGAPLVTICIVVCACRRRIEVAIRRGRGVSYRRFRLQLLMTRALVELESHRSVKEVSIMFGYRYPRTFSRAFREVHGVLPTTVRDPNK